jgi:hypothetical protein
MCKKFNVSLHRKINTIMKYSKTLTILLFSSLITLYSCNEKTNSPKKVEETPRPFVPAVPEPSKNVGFVYHYTCSKGCAGGSGSAANCSNCGSLLVHNQAFHNNANSKSTNAPFSSQPADPAKNVAGVWHYTCEKGCVGGAGAAGNCGACGSALAHNQAYHQ